MANNRQRARCRERLGRISESSLDSESIRRESIVELQRTIGFDRWCWPSADPETLLPLSGLAEHDYGPQLPRALELEFSGNDFAAKHTLARRPGSAASLSVETGADLARSPRWDEVMRHVGIGDVAVAACRDAVGCWGWIEAYRDESDRAFDEADLELLTDVGSCLGSALRRTSTPAFGDGRALEPSPPGVIVLNEELRVVSWTAGARAWVDVLPAAELFTAWGMLPPVVYPIATLSRSRHVSDAHALERTVDGRWLMTQAAALEGDDQGKVAVTLRGATSAELFAVLSRAYALTRREREVVAALVAGLDTRALAERLFISRHTVQDHLKSVFDKIGVHSRREVVARFNPSADGAASAQ